MSEAVAWFRPSQPDRPGTLNPVFQLLDRAVIAGESDHTVLVGPEGPVTFATLLEEVAVVGGVLVAHGVVPGTPVAVRGSHDRRTATALLALARLGAVLDPDAELAVTPDAVGEVEWDLVPQVGRTDPASAAELAADAPWREGIDALALATLLRSTATPVQVGDLVRALAGTTIEG